MTAHTPLSVNYSVRDRDLKYYIFDWDDNILHMPTRIYLERKTDDGQWVPHSVSTAVFSVIRNDPERFRPPDGDWEKAFLDFRDVTVDNENVFLRDTRQAIEQALAGQGGDAPSFARFRRTLVEGRLFAIVTARGHHPRVLRAAVEYFIARVLSPDEKREMLASLRGYLECFEPGHGLVSDEAVMDYYLRHNRYHGVMSPEFRSLMGERPGASPNAEAGKQFAIRDFVEHVMNIAANKRLTKPISVGFSDDDSRNAEAVETYIRRELGRRFPKIKFVVYYTNDPEVPSGRKVVVSGQLGLPLGPAGAAAGGAAGAARGKGGHS